MSFETKNIRNIILLGHPGCGKTTLAETMLFEGKSISRRGNITDQSTTSDYTNIEQERGNSIFSTLLNTKWKDSKINIVDTPGFDDFVGEIISSIKVADTSVMLINAKDGVEVGTELIWEYVEKFKTPNIFVVNHCDNEKADFDAALEQAVSRFGNKVIPVQYPLEQGIGFNTIVDSLRMICYHFPDGGGKPEKQPIPEAEMEKAKAMHNALVEAAAENDEGLMEKFFEAGTLTEEELTKGLRIAMNNQDILPVFCCSAERNMGSGRIMGFLNDIAPSPNDRAGVELEDGSMLPTDSTGDTSIFIFKTLTEPQVGKVTYFKVHSGSLKAGDELVNASNDGVERITQLFSANGKTRTPVDVLHAGDIGVTVKLKNTNFNETLNAKGIDRKIKPIEFPSPRIRTAVNPPSKAEMEKLIKALNQIQAEDPTFKVEQNATLKQTILHGQGQLQLDIIKYRIEKVNNVSMEFMQPKISYRETITKSARDHHRHKKQSGGSGQFAEVHMTIDPWYEGIPLPAGFKARNEEVEQLPWGGKLVFVWCIVGGSIDAKFSNAIKKGIMNKMEEGPLTGSYCQDIRVCVFDGKMHPVDSNDMAFMLASTHVFKAAFNQAAPQLLEPIYDLEIMCSGDVMGDVMSDLQTRRAVIQGMDADGHYQKIMAKVPLAELYQYSSTLRSITQGRAKFKQAFAEFSAVPHDLQKSLINEYQSSLQEA